MAKNGAKNIITEAVNALKLAHRRRLLENCMPLWPN